MPTEPPVPGLVSVTLVVYNGERDVAQAIDSVLGQNYPAFEVIAVDDGSTDGTWEVLRSYGHRIRAVRQPNGGLPVARNTGLRHARGEFIALMDHDDLCMPERLSVQVAFLRAHPAVGLCGSDFSAFNEHGPIEPSHIATYYAQYARAQGRPAALYPHSGTLDVAPCLPEPSGQPCLVDVYKGDVYERIACGNFVHPPTVMVRAEVLRGPVGSIPRRGPCATGTGWSAWPMSPRSDTSIARCSTTGGRRPRCPPPSNGPAVRSTPSTSPGASAGAIRRSCSDAAPR